MRMETKEVTVCLETNTTPVLKSTMAMTQTVSNEFIKIMELRESCNIFESYLKDFEIKIQLLLTSKSESANLKDVYLARNRTNMTNTESLRLAKNELYKYKCELKADYIATEKALKAKRLKYKKVVASYEFDWQKTLEQYNSNPLVTELCNLQQEISDMEKQFDELDRLYDFTKTQFTSFNKDIRKKFVEKVVEFSKEMLLYKTVIERRVAEKKKKELEEKQQKPEHLQHSFFKHGFLKLAVESSETSNEGNNYSGIDVSMFDDMMIPIQNLETQNEEELFPLLDTEPKPLVSGGFDKTQAVDLKTEDSQASHSEKPDKESVSQVEDICKPNLVKPKVTENESQYFQPDNSKPPQSEGIHVSEVWNQTEGTHRKFENKEDEFAKRGEPSIHSKSNTEKYRNEEEFRGFLQGARNFQMESEGNVSDGSCESQYDCLIQNKSLEDKQRAIYEYHDDFEPQYFNPSPTSSSEEIPRGMSAENPNDSGGSLDQPPKETQNARGSSKNETKPQEDAFKSFTNFFTMNDDYNSPTPSIFKLF